VFALLLKGLSAEARQLRPTSRRRLAKAMGAACAFFHGQAPLQIYKRDMAIHEGDTAIATAKNGAPFTTSVQWPARRMAYDNGGQETYVYVKRGSKATRRPHKNEGKTYKPTRAEDVSGESPKGVETADATKLRYYVICCENPQWG